MLHKVVKPFPFSENGFTLIDLSVGDERDFGAMADGLVAAGFIEAVSAKASASVPGADEGEAPRGKRK